MAIMIIEYVSAEQNTNGMICMKGKNACSKQMNMADGQA